MKKLNQLLTKEDMLKVIQFSNTLTEWEKETENEVIKMWYNNCNKVASRIVLDYNAIGLDGFEILYHFKGSMDSIKELYRGKDTERYQIVYGMWELIYYRYNEIEE